MKTLQEARAEDARGTCRAALTSALTSRKLLQSILDAVALSTSGGQAQFVSLQGEVEYKRSDGGSWEEARGRLPLRAGDYVRTGNGGSAEIIFLDGTLYTVRANTQFVISSAAGSGSRPVARGPATPAGQSLQID